MNLLSNRNHPSVEMKEFAGISEDVLDELKAKNLLPFVLDNESQTECIKFSVYENEKYRAVIGEWGSVRGVHLIRGIDRSPFTNEQGNIPLHVSLNELSPIKGYKWSGEWGLVIDTTSTDPDG